MTIRESDRLWFITSVANPCGYQSRYNLYDNFVDHITKTVRANLLTVECAFDDEDHHLKDDPSNSNYKIVRVRSKSRLWNKENLCGIGIRHIPKSARYVCWCDADIEFLQGASIKDDIIRGLESFDVVQCFSSALDLGPLREIMKVHHGFGFCHVMGVRPDVINTERETFRHPGYVFATRKDFLDKVGGLFDVGIVGSGDYYMAMGLIGKADECLTTDFSDDYKDAILQWQARVATHLTKGLGYCAGVVRHGFHGYKKDRGYHSRNKILKTHEFSPSNDLVKNDDGVLEFQGNKPDLERDVLEYFKSRKEDAGL